MNRSMVRHLVMLGSQGRQDCPPTSSYCPAKNILGWLKLWDQNRLLVPMSLRRWQHRLRLCLGISF